MTKRPVFDVATPPGGWGAPWPNVAEIEAELPHQNWTLVGGLMVQLHGIHHGIEAIRPTNDVDVVLHVETSSDVARRAAEALERIGYELVPTMDGKTAHRFRRGAAKIDFVGTESDTVDVLAADHAAPRSRQRLRGLEMVTIEGGTQALRRTQNARLAITPGRTTTVSVPSPFGGLVLKAAAYQTDSRDRERHLVDAALLLSVIEDPYAERVQFAGSDQMRLQALRRVLLDDVPAWRPLPATWRLQGQAALRILTAW